MRRADEIGEYETQKLLEVQRTSGDAGVAFVTERLLFHTCGTIARACGIRRLHELLRMVETLFPMH